ncbi:glycosyltransferase family 4 protein [Cellulomonas sp. P5_C6]
MPEPLRVALDATPLVGPRTGVGTYVQHLVSGLAARGDVSVDLTAFSGRAQRPADLPAAVGWRHRAVPARVLRASWLRTPLPRVEWLAGRHDVFHGTNFVQPPSGAAGVVMIHDLSYERYPELVSAASRQYRTLVPRGLRYADVVVTPSAAIRDEVVEHYGVAADRVVATPLGVAPEWFAAEPLDPARVAALGLPDEYVVFVGTREPRKNLSTLLAGFAAYRAAGGTLGLVLVGASGWADLSPGPGTVVLPHLPGAEVRGLVAGARALAMPSLYEGFGLPVLEALAAGTPVLCSDIPVLREVGGTHVRLVAPTDVDAWADALVTAPARDQDAGRAWAGTFTWQRCVDATVGAYRQAVAAH